MKKWIVSVMLLFVLCLNAYGVDDIDIALALAKAKSNILAPTVVQSGNKAGTEAYAVARSTAIANQKTLIVWIGHNNPTASQDLASDSVQVSLGTNFFKRGKDQEILVGKYFAGELWIVPGIEITDSPAIIRTKVNNYVIQQGGCP